MTTTTASRSAAVLDDRRHPGKDPTIMTSAATLAYAATVHILLIQTDPADTRPDTTTGGILAGWPCITTNRAHPRIPSHVTALRAIRAHLGREAPRPEFVGLLPDGDGVSALFAAYLPPPPAEPDNATADVAAVHRG